MFLSADQPDKDRLLIQYHDPRPEHLQRTIDNLLALDIYSYGLAKPIMSYLLEMARRPGSDPVLFYFPFQDGQPLIRELGPPDDAHSILCFSSYERARGFIHNASGSDSRFSVQRATLSLLKLRMQEDLPAMEVYYIDLDPYAHCETSVNAYIPEVLQNGLLAHWAAIQAYNEVVCEGLLGLARQELLAARIASAREVALEIVQNVEPEKPEAHLILAMCGHALKDETMLQQARHNLIVLDCEWALQLLQLIKAGRVRLTTYPVY